MKKSGTSDNEIWSGDVTDRASFLAYIAHARSELNSPVRPTTWKNETLDEFLEAMGRWVADTEGGPDNSNPWLHAAQLIEAAWGYE